MLDAGCWMLDVGCWGTSSQPDVSISFLCGFLSALYAAAWWPFFPRFPPTTERFLFSLNEFFSFFSCLDSYRCWRWILVAWLFILRLLLFYGDWWKVLKGWLKFLRFITKLYCWFLRHFTNKKKAENCAIELTALRLQFFMDGVCTWTGLESIKSDILQSRLIKK